MANKFKKGDKIIGIGKKPHDYGITCKGWKGTVVNVRENGTKLDVSGPGIYSDTDVESKYFELINKPKTKDMAKKTKTGGITPKEGMYFTANMGKKKVRGCIGSVYTSSFNNCTEVMLDGKDFSNKDEDADFPTYEILEYNKTGETFEEALKKKKITNFTVCTDKRQKAVIDGDKAPKFGDWRVVQEGNNIVFGCGKVDVAIKDAKTFATIFCDYGNPEAIYDYDRISSGEDIDFDYIENYYQVRKWLEDNWTAAQIEAFDDVLEQIRESGEQPIDELECSEMKELLAKF